jgi:hypothetical protein
MGMNPRLLRPTASGFNPRSIANLQAWYDAASVSTLGPTSSGVGAVSNNGPVKFIQDKSNSGFDLTQTGADSVSPTYVTGSQNGLPVLSFDGGDDIFGSGSSSAIMTAPFTLFLACRADPVGFVPRICGVTGFRSIGPFGAGDTIGFFSMAGVSRSFGVPVATPVVLAMSCTSGLVGNLYGNGTLSVTDNVQSVTEGPFTLGRESSTSGTRATGAVYECLSYSRALTSLEVSTVTRYLGKKWGIAVA